MRQSIPGRTAVCPEPAPIDLHWVAITNALIDFDLTPREFQLVIILLSYRWFEHSPIIPSVKTLAGRMRCSVRVVQYAMAGLVKKRLIERQYCYRPDGGQMSNLYVVGPALRPLLAPANPVDSAGGSEDQHTPMQDLADKRPQRNQMNGTSWSQDREHPKRAAENSRNSFSRSCVACAGAWHPADRCDVARGLVRT
jgi:hypothetical protein